MKLGERLRELRKQSNYTLRDLSQMTGISLPHLSKLECNKANPRLDTLGKLACVHKLSIKELFPTEPDYDEFGFYKFCNQDIVARILFVEFADGRDADPGDPFVQMDIDSVRRVAKKILKAISP